MNMRRILKSLRLFICILTAMCCLSVTESKPDEPDKAKNSASDSMLGKEPGQVRDDNGLKMKLVWCPPGTFTMGSPKSEANRGDDEDPVEVTLTKGFWLGKYEVTQSEWTQVMSIEPWKGEREGDDIPATHICWDDAMEFCRKLTERERKAGRIPEDWGYTLPTEAQWEHACRAGTKTKFSFGDNDSKIGEYAWIIDNALNAGEDVHNVGLKKPNPWGLHDLHGNLFEWCRDAYAETLPGGRDPVVMSKKSLRVLRGGSWQFISWRSRSACRNWWVSSAQDFILGFRVALSSTGNK